MGKSGDPEGEASTTLNTTLSKPKDPKMQAAKVHMLNGTTKDFELHRGSDGDVLFTMASIDLSIEEREYFSLCFYDDQDLRHWLYNDKKILRQLKGLPWEFSFEVKFYPTAPATLNDDNARCTLFLQLRKDVASGRLPATIPTLALLGALVAQAEYGDADSTAEYERYLRDSLKVPNLKDQTQLNELLEKVKELHREQKGLTASEAESKYLDACKQLSMYGVFIFDAKDNDNNKVGIGICATGINIYKETIRVHRFAWQNIVKISYKKNSFSIKLKAGEMDKKETTLHYKVHDYLHAKRVWKCGVEHHTFFRLIQPEDKPKGGLFRWGSTRFRYQGRTQFQTKMASQMFDQSQGGTVPRAASARLTQSCDHGLNKENIPVHDKSTTLGRDGQPESPVTSPGVSYEISSAKRAGTTNGKSKKSKKSKGEHEADSSDSSSSDEEHRVKVVPVVEQTTPIEQQENSADHKLVRHETKEQSYRLSGQGRSSGFNPEQPSLSTTIAEAERLNQRSPRLEHAERTITVRALAPLPVSFEESGQPHTTVASWQETTLLPDNVTVEYDDKGNRITRTVKTSQVKHTVQKQTFQNYTVPDETDPSSTVERSREQMTPLGLSTHTGPVVDTKTRSVVYEASSPSQGGTESVGEFVSSKTVTSGNRTIETITYKTERDGIIETHVEHRVTIHSDLPIDHDAELSAAIAEATQMNPDMTVEKIEVRQETST